jgi:hypothetical protein
MSLHWERNTARRWFYIASSQLRAERELGSSVSTVMVEGVEILAVEGICLGCGILGCDDMQSC